MSRALRLTITQRLCLVFAIFLLASMGVAACLLVWLRDVSTTHPAQSPDPDALTVALWTLACMVLASLVAGTLMLAWIVRPLDRRTGAVRRGDAKRPELPLSVIDAFRRVHVSDRSSDAETAFEQMRVRVSDRWRELAQRERERHRFATRVARELHAPLTSLNGYLNTLASDRDDGLHEAERRRYLGIALDQSRKVGALAHALFELERIDQGFTLPDAHAVDLDALVCDVCTHFEFAAETRNITLSTRRPPSLRPVRADAVMIERILIHLLDNAIRHTPYDGVIEVDVEPIGERVAVTVSDSGPGMTREHIDTLYESAFAIAPSGRDVHHPAQSGLGLLVVHRLLALHHSRLRLIDRPGKGTVLRFELPCFGADAQKKTAT